MHDHLRGKKGRGTDEKKDMSILPRATMYVEHEFSKRREEPKISEKERR